MSPFRIRNTRILGRLVVEGGLIFCVLYALAMLTLVVTPAIHATSSDWPFTVLVTSLIFTGCFVGVRRARLGDDANPKREMILISVLSLLIGVTSFLGFWAVKGSPMSLAAFLPLEGAVAVPFVLVLIRWLSGHWGVFVWPRERIVILGTGENAKQVCRWVFEHVGRDYTVVCFAAGEPRLVGQVMCMGVRVWTDHESMLGYCLKNADRVIVAVDERRGKLPVKQLMELRLRGVAVEESVSFVERTCGKLSIESMLPSWLIFSDGFRSSRARSVSKRAADLALSALLLVLTAPLMILTALLVKLDSRGPVLYKQKRVGQDGKEFELYKFRSMSEDAEERSGPTWASASDPRVTRVGRWIRPCRIDELPQLFNVFRGDMSFVGPRPERSHFVEQLKDVIPYYGLRSVARPGITGWAQVCYRYGASVDDALEKLKYDLYYVKNANLLFDIWIVLKTVKVVLTGAGAR